MTDSATVTEIIRRGREAVAGATQAFDALAATLSQSRRSVTP